MNFEQSGKQFAIIKNKKDKKNNKVIYNEYDDKNIKSYFGELHLTDPDEYFELYPDTKGNRRVAYCCGQSGAGKSYWARQYLENYHNLYPKNKIYIFSAITEDETLDKLKYLKRIKLDDKFLNFDLSDVKLFQDTLTIFDDCDTITNKYIHEKVYTVLNLLLETGRHANASVIYTNHLCTDGRTTRRILSECHTLTYFPQVLGGRSKKYLLMDYLGLSKEEMKKLKNIKSRAITICKLYPKICLAEKDIFILKSED
jgi:hypothetical protein